MTARPTPPAVDKPKPCDKGQQHLKCPTMLSTYDGFDGERYRCERCGQSIWLDYEDMK